MSSQWLARRQFLRLLAGGLLTGTGFAGAAEPARQPLRIGLSLGLSGAYANDGAMQHMAYQLWASHVNLRGGLLGRRVELLVRDDGSDPALARTIYETLILRDRVDLLFSPYSSAITFAVAPITERHGYPLLAAGAASDEIWKQGHHFIFATIPPATRQTIGFLALLADARIGTLQPLPKERANGPENMVCASSRRRNWRGEQPISNRRRAPPGNPAPPHC